MNGLPSLLPDLATDRADEDDRSDCDEPREQAEDDPDSAVDPAVRRDRRREVQGPEALERKPESSRDNGRAPKPRPRCLPGKQEVHRPPEEDERHAETGDSLKQQAGG